MYGAATGLPEPQADHASGNDDIMISQHERIGVFSQVTARGLALTAAWSYCV
jgi:hypothetical protein